MGPCPKLLAIEQQDQEIDSWFELMKRLQQYPDKEPDWEGLPGTPLIDWSSSQILGCFLQIDIARHHNLEQYLSWTRQELESTDDNKGGGNTADSRRNVA